MVVAYTTNQDNIQCQLSEQGAVCILSAWDRSGTPAMSPRQRQQLQGSWLWHQHDQTDTETRGPTAVKLSSWPEETVSSQFQSEKNPLLLSGRDTGRRKEKVMGDKVEEAPGEFS